MNITETVSYDKDGHITSNRPWQRLFVPLIVILVGLLGFGVGRLTSGPQGEAIKIMYDPELSSIMNGGEGARGQTASAIESLKPLPAPIAGGVVASKNGTKYHYLHCPGAKQIKDENKISFNSASEAESSGYTLAGNCKAP
jgi:hypothetical protein